MKELTDENIKSYEKLITPGELKKRYPLSEKSEETVLKSRKEIKNIFNNKEDKIIIITGPCSIHDIKTAKEYAQKLRKLSKKVKDKFLLVMRTYFEKPRTTTGWKGLIYDPFLDGSNDLSQGLSLARQLLINITKQGIPAGIEFLGPLTPQYMDDLVSWAAIGARTTESQPHREMASGLSMPIGFKNTTSGNIQLAINAVQSATHPHAFLGASQDGMYVIVHTKGNPYAHVILRGGKKKGKYKSNYQPSALKKTTNLLQKEDLPTGVIIDCSHANSDKNYKNQPPVFKNVINQILAGNHHIKGLMLESNLQPGHQDIKSKKLSHGISITDPCLSWGTTQKIILEAYHKMKQQ